MLTNPAATVILAFEDSADPVLSMLRPIIPTIRINKVAKFGIKGCKQVLPSTKPCDAPKDFGAYQKT